MGFFSKKKSKKRSSSVVSDITPEYGEDTSVGSAVLVDAAAFPAAAAGGADALLGDGGNESDISDDYVAPNIDDLEAAGVKATAGEGGPTAAAETGLTGMLAALVGSDKPAPATTTTTPTAAASATAATAAAPSEVPRTSSTPANKNESPVKPAPSLIEQLSSKLTSPSSLSVKTQPCAINNQATNINTTNPSSTNIDVEDIEDGYVNANNLSPGLESPPDNEGEEPFVKGAVQPPKYKDVKYLLLFILHLGMSVWWFVDSFLPEQNVYNENYYSKTSHVGLVIFISLATVSGLLLTFLTFGYMLRHGITFLKTTVVFSTGMCFGVGVLGLFLGEYLMMICGFVGFGVVGVYANMVWSRIPFTAANLSVAISAVRENMGLFLAALCVSAIGFLWLLLALCGDVHAYKTWGWYTLLYSLFSYYWVLQVMTNVVGVVTAGIIGRWFVMGECTPRFTAGLRETFSRARTYSLGSICFGSLFFGIFSFHRGLANFLCKKGVPLLPTFFECVALGIEKIFIGHINERSYAYVGLYGYSYKAASTNVTLLLKNKGFYDKVQRKLHSDILFMANMTIGLLTGFCGLIIGTFEYNDLYRSGLSDPTSDGFILGFFVGFFFSSILLSVASATVNTIVVCFAESPTEFRTNHRDLSQKMDDTWGTKSKSKSKGSSPQKMALVL